MSKDLEEGEIEDGELPEELAETSVADDVGLDTSLPAGHKCLPGLNFALPYVGAGSTYRSCPSKGRFGGKA